jgi:transglutaminase-like putative cysteine protease
VSAGGADPGWRLRIVHRTHVRYEGSARASYNEARMTPPTQHEQSVLETRVSTDIPAPMWTYSDYWGTLVSSFDIQAPHHELMIHAQATVETRPAAGSARPLPWSVLRERSASGRLLEFLTPTKRTAVDETLAATARQRTASADPLEAAAEIAGWVSDRVAYVPGATEVQTSAQEAWDQGKGVCQDIAHLTVALMREVGLPARYVSGYFHPQPEAQPGDEVAAESHAWVEYWVGEWVACDPTNRAQVGERHVTVAAGRDYADVSPLKGIYHGAPSSTMDVTVAVTRLA